MATARERSRSPRGKSGAGSCMQSAFVFIKPHAVTPACQALVYGYFTGAGFSVTREGELTSEVIDEKKLIDQHYYAIASKATLLKPAELNVPADKFEAKFGIGWEEAKSKNLVFNALDACSELGVDGTGLENMWREISKDHLIKFGGGFYCGKLTVPGRETPMYVFNGFFMGLRGSFTAPGKKIHFYVVEWDASKVSWKDFRGQMLGPTNPAEAPRSSLRGIINARWQELGLTSAPNTGDNGVHASASPFEGMAERNNWLGVPLEEDPFGAKLRSAGLSFDWIKAGCVDPQVKQDASGKMASLFDAVEDTDFAECCQKLKELSEL